MQNEWMDLFPTIVTKAKTLQVLDSEQLGGTLHLVINKADYPPAHLIYFFLN